MNINKEQAESIEFELPSILKGGMFSGAANLAIFKNHNEATSNTSSDYSNLS